MPLNMGKSSWYSTRSFIPADKHWTCWKVLSRLPEKKDNHPSLPAMNTVSCNKDLHARHTGTNVLEATHQLFKRGSWGLNAGPHEGKNFKVRDLSLPTTCIILTVSRQDLLLPSHPVATEVKFFRFVSTWCCAHMRDPSHGAHTRLLCMVHTWGPPTME